MSLFRAFMLNWTVSLNAPIERYFEELGEDRDIEVSLLRFGTDHTDAALIVPLVHPGPFKNLGSSLLPSQMKREFEKVFGGEACVPLGILGHELDVASQGQSQEIIKIVLASSKQKIVSDTATPFTKVTKDNVTVCCQVFGDEAVVSFSLAPKTTEDLPQELGDFVREQARKFGLKDAIVINAHNSITDVATMEEPLQTLETVASECLKRVISSKRSSFKVGAN